MKPTFYDRIMTRLQNHRMVAILLLVAALIVGLANFTSALKSLTDLFAKPDPQEARLKLSSLSVAYTPDAFVDAAAAGDLLLMKLFLTAGMDPNVVSVDGDGPVALFVAAKGNHLAVAEALLKAGAKIKVTPGNNCLLGAVLSGNVAMVDLLLKKPVAHADIDEAFTAGGDRAILATLLAHGADIKKNGAEALVYSHAPEAVAFLIAQGADINARDAAGRTYLERLNWRSLTMDTLQILIDRRADLTARDKTGRTLLHHFADLGSANRMELLLKQGADVNARDQEGLTPLAILCRNGLAGESASLDLLLKYKADVQIADNTGKTPLDYANTNSAERVKQLLREHAAAR